MLHFDPPLSSALTVHAPSAFLEGSCLQLYATLPREEYAALCRDGTEVQAWSDFGTGEWSAMSFKERDLDVPQDSVADFVLGPGERVPDVDAEAEVVKLVAATPLLPLVGRTVQFTYRMVHAAGAVGWLGSVGTNGSITVEVATGQAVAEWRADPHAPGVFVWRDGMGRGTAPQVVGRLCRSADWAGWAIGKEGPSRFAALSATVAERVAVALIPTARPGAYITHTPVLYYTTGSATLSLTAEGEIVFYPGDCDSVLHASTSTRTWSNAISDKATTFEVHSPAFLGVSVQHDAHVGRIHVLPVSSAMDCVRLTPADLSYLAAPSDTFALVDSAARFAKFLTTSSPEGVRVAVGHTGGEMLVSPGYTLRNAGGEWHVACLPRGTGLVTSVCADAARSICSHESISSSNSDDLVSKSTVTEDLFEPKDTVKLEHPTDFVEVQVLTLVLGLLHFFLRLVALSLSITSASKISSVPANKRIASGLVGPPRHQVTITSNILLEPIPKITFDVAGDFSIVVGGHDVSKVGLSVEGSLLPAPKDLGGTWIVESDAGDHETRHLEVTLHE